MTKLFEKFLLKNIVLRNRSVLSAAYGPDLEKLALLAAKEVGLIISGGTSQKEINSFEEAIKAIHKNQGKISLQIVTDLAGFFGQDKDIIAVSALAEDHPFFNTVVKYSCHHAASEDEIDQIIESYVQAAVVAQSIGADGVQIHSAHQSFLSQFLSPLTNMRTDAWGGSIENRTRIHKEIYQRIQKRVGEDFPILISCFKALFFYKILVFLNFIKKD